MTINLSFPSAMENFAESILQKIPSTNPEAHAEFFPASQVVVFKPTVLFDTSVAFDCYEFVVTLSSFPPVMVDGSYYQIPPFHIFPINPGQRHCAKQYAINQNYWAVFISHEFLKALALAIYGKGKIEFENRFHSLIPSFLPLVKIYADESQNKEAGSKLMLETLSTQISVILMRHLRSNCLFKRFDSRSSEDRINKSVELLRDCFDEKITLDDLAAVAQMSPYHFLRLFKKYTGKTPHQYLTELRIEKVKHLLISSRLSITDICHRCGFDYGNHFSAVFKRSVGLSPRDFRKRA